jgi:hypothetical protein
MGYPSPAIHCETEKAQCHVFLDAFDITGHQWHVAQLSEIMPTGATSFIKLNYVFR